MVRILKTSVILISPDLHHFPHGVEPVWPPTPAISPISGGRRSSQYPTTGQSCWEGVLLHKSENMACTGGQEMTVSRGVCVAWGPGSHFPGLVTVSEQ